MHRYGEWVTFPDAGEHGGMRMKKLGLHILLSAVLLSAMVGCAPEQDQPGVGEQRETTSAPPTTEQPQMEQPQEAADEYTVTLQEVGGSGVSGEGTVTVNGDSVTVMVDVEGLEANQAYPLIIHAGDAGVIGGRGMRDPGQPGQQPTEPSSPGQQPTEPGSPGQRGQQGQPGMPDQPGSPGQRGQMMQPGDVSGPMLALLPFPEAGADGTVTFQGTFENAEPLMPLDNLSLTVFGMSENGEVDITQPAATGQFEESTNRIGAPGAPGMETTPGAPGQETTPDVPGGGPGTGNGMGGPGTGPGTTEP